MVVKPRRIKGVKDWMKGCLLGKDTDIFEAITHNSVIQRLRTGPRCEASMCCHKADAHKHQNKLLWLPWECSFDKPCCRSWQQPTWEQIPLLITLIDQLYLASDVAAYLRHTVLTCACSCVSGSICCFALVLNSVIL